MHHQHHTQKELSQPALLILASLMHGPRDAVALQEAIEQAEGLYIEPGTLYRVLAHLEQHGWIERLDAEGPLRPQHGRAESHACCSQRHVCSPAKRRNRPKGLEDCPACCVLRIPPMHRVHSTRHASPWP